MLSKVFAQFAAFNQTLEKRRQEVEWQSCEIFNFGREQTPVLQKRA
jgi:hypothetical protein